MLRFPLSGIIDRERVSYIVYLTEQLAIMVILKFTSLIIPPLLLPAVDRGQQ